MTTTSASPVSNTSASERRNARKRLAAAALLLALGITTAAAAPDTARRPGEKDNEYARRLHEQGLIVSLESILEKAQSVHAGKLLEVEFDVKHAEPRYEVELLDAKGQVWELKFDARDGRFIKEKREDD